MKYLILLGMSGLALVGSMIPAGAAASPKPSTVPSYIASAVSDSHRPSDQVLKDVDRHPAEIIAFSGMKPGDVVADFMPGSGYFTRLFSQVVGKRGRVYAIIPAEMIRAGGAEEFEGTVSVGKNPSYSNVSVMTENTAQFSTPQKLDVAFFSQNYHDLYNDFMEHAYVAAMNRAIYRALKPGEIYLVIDHIAAPGTGHRDTGTLHRIDPASIRQEVSQTGFELMGESALLRNPDDDHSLPVFDRKIRGHTDQIILKFRKPVRRN